MTPRDNSRACLIAFTGLSLAGAWACAKAVGLGLDYLAWLRLLGPILLATATIVFIAHRRGLARIAACAESILFGVALTVPVLISSYLGIRLGQPLADETLAAMDRAIGFDWIAFVRFVDSRPLLAEILRYSYSSFGLQLILLPAILSLVGQENRAYRMLLAFGVTGLSASAISIWFPALGTYVVYAPEDIVHINTHYGYFFLEQFHAVRADPGFVLDPEKAAGIITFPSVHAAVGALLIWAAWTVRPIRYPVAVLNLLMIVSAVSHANHYLVDVIAGVALSVLAILAVRAVTRPASVASSDPAPNAAAGHTPEIA